MKKLGFLLLTATLILGLSACENAIVEIPIEPSEPVIPVETEDPIIAEDSSSESTANDTERTVEVPVALERQRRYQPGTYMLAETRSNTQNGYVFTVVVIDDYGRIAGVYIDQTISTRNLFRSSDGHFFSFVEGNRLNIPDSFRRVDLSRPLNDYPVRSDAIRSRDLIVGIDTTAIRDLTRVSVNETKQLTSLPNLQNGALNYQEQMIVVANKIVEDNTTYGFNLVNRNGTLTTNSVPGISEALDVPLGLVQSILDGPARLSNESALRSLATPRYGTYVPGVYTSFSSTSFIDDALIHGLSLVVVDAFGRISGIYLDEIIPSTARASVVASKQILKEAVGLAATQPFEWNEQANQVARQIILNQGLDGVVLVDAVSSAITPLEPQAPRLRVGNMPNITFRVNDVLLATQHNLSRAIFKEYVDGTYIISSTQHANVFGYITIKDQTLVDVWIDRFVSRDQAVILRQDESVLVQRFTRNIPTAGTSVPADLLVYAIGDNVYSVDRVTRIQDISLVPTLQLAPDQRILLSEEERATLRAVPGWQTAGQLRAVDETQRQWFDQQHRIATAIQQQGTINGFQLLNGRIVNVAGLEQTQADTTLDVVAAGLFQARDGANRIFDTPFIAQELPLADGAYVAYSTPAANGAISFTYLVVYQGRIVTWIVDQTRLQNNQLTSQLLVDDDNKEALVTLTNALQEQQTDVILQLITRQVPDPVVASIQTHPVFSTPHLPSEMGPLTGVLDEVIQQAITAKQTQDMEWIYDAFLTDPAYFKDRTLVALSSIGGWLPSSINDPALLRPYRLVWRTSDRDLSITLSQEQYSLQVFDLDFNKIGDLELEIYAANQNTPLAVQTFRLPMQRRLTFGEQLLASKEFDLPRSILVENASFDLPSSGELPIVWISSRPNVMTATGQTLGVSQPNNVELTAFVDLDGNNQLGPNEPFRTYQLTVLPLAQALTRIESELDTNIAGEFIGNRLTLTTTSSVGGVTYAWNSSSPEVVLVQREALTEVYIGSTDVPTNVTLQAVVNIGNNVISKTFRVDAGSIERYERFATTDLPVPHTTLEMIRGQSLFDAFSAVGPFYKSDVSFYTTDFGRFVNPAGTIIFQHPTVDACFEVVTAATYSGGTKDATATMTSPFCVISQQRMLDQISIDRKQLKDYIIDLRLMGHADQTFVLPTKGMTSQHPITWTVLNNPNANVYDVSALASGVVRVATTNPALTAGDDLQLRATFDVIVGPPAVDLDETIVVRVRGTR